MVDKRKITLLAEAFYNSAAPADWDFGYGDYDEIVPQFFDALGDDEAEIVSFIESATRKQRFLVNRLREEIEEMFDSPEIAAALDGIAYEEFTGDFFDDHPAATE